VTIVTHIVKPNTGYEVAPSRLASIEGTATEARTGHEYTTQDYTVGDAPFVFGLIESTTGATLFLEF
jgi:hypothetical protein